MLSRTPGSQPIMLVGGGLAQRLELSKSFLRVPTESKQALKADPHLTHADIRENPVQMLYDLATNSLPFIPESLLTQLPILIPDITILVWANLSRRRHPAFIVRGDFISLYLLCFHICQVLGH